jgi:hypothetical protein
MMRMTSGLLVLEAVGVEAGIALEGELLTAMEFIREAIGCATTQSLQNMSAAQGPPMCHFLGHCRYILLRDSS